VLLVPYLTLMAVGIVLFWRHRTLATALAALGFGAIGLSHTLGQAVGLYISTPDRFAAAIHQIGWTFPVTHWGSIAGIWVGSLGLLWHALKGEPGRHLTIVYGLLPQEGETIKGDDLKG